jgi:hypothetical protein
MVLQKVLKKLSAFSKTNEVKFWLTIYSYFDVSMILREYVNVIMNIIT